MKGQKEAVIEEVLLQLPGFVKYTDNAILLLNHDQLELIKSVITNLIVNGVVDYSKDRTNHNEVRTYARSMVMNHLKKAKELNGGHTFTISGGNVRGSTDDADVVHTTPARTIRVKAKIAPKGVDPDLLPSDLKEFVKSLV